MSTIAQDDTCTPVVDASSGEHWNIQDAVSLNALGIAYLDKFKAQRTLALLDDAIASFKAASRLQPSDDPTRPDTLYNIADALRDRYRISRDRADLKAVIAYHQDALDLRPVGHSSRLLSLGKFADVLLNSYQDFGDLADLDAAIGHYLEALTLCPPGHSSRWMVLNNLSLALKRRFTVAGNRDDLEEVISLPLQTLELLPLQHSSRHLLLNNVGTALKLWHEHFDDDADLEAAIGYHMKALDLRPVGNPYRSRSLANLGNVLLARYRRFGNFADITTAIEYLRCALAANAQDPDARANILTMLASGLDLRFAQLREQEDLDTMVRYQTEVLELRPPGHPDRPTPLSNLVRGFLLRYNISNVLADLDEAATYIAEACDLSPIGYPFRLANLHLFASIYVRRFKRLKDRKDIDEAISRYQSILDNPPESQTQLAALLQNFAAALRGLSILRESMIPFVQCSPPTLQRMGVRDNRLEHEAELQSQIQVKSVLQDSPDAVKAIRLLRDATNLETCPIHARLKAALEWVRVAETVRHDSLNIAYRVALRHLWSYVTVSQNVISQHVRLSDPDHDLEGAVTVASAAAAFALEHSNVPEAVQCLEQGRLIITNQLDSYRVPLDNLRAIDKDLADEFGRLRLQMELGLRVEQTTRLNSDVPGTEDKIAREAGVSKKWFETVGRIRRLPGFSDFLMPTPWDRLQTAAAGGPVIIVNISRIRSDAIIIPQDLSTTPLVIHLPLAKPGVVRKLSNDLRDAVRTQPSDITTKIANVLRELWDIIVIHVAKGLESNLKVPRRSRVWWCLTSIAWSLPFHAAGPYVPEKRGFSDRYTSSYTPTLMTLIRSREAHTRPVPAKPVPRILMVGMIQTPGEASLPCVSEEIARIQKASESVTVLEGPAATRDEILSHLNDHSWAHFACHGFQDEKNAFDSHFLLVQKRLTLLDILKSGLPNAELAFLSACHSAAGDARMPDEAIHLAAGIQFAGFAGVVRTLWSMADVDGPDVAEEFYKYMFRNGERADYTDAASALAAATSALRRKKVPLERWINFVHYGA
ncbi:hypothetical protein FRB95_007380 [Tulasnella sp. JGI-2019a]|nr:hypothetical protein FRB95_007380 [Tulasnella sp. JGI-2019a]